MNFDDLSKKLNQIIDEVQTKEFYEELGSTAVERIKTRTRLGKGVSKRGGQAETLKPLAPTYIEDRQYLKQKGKLSSKTTPSRSNLTKTGAMLDATTHKATNKEAVVTVVGEEEKRKVKENADLGRIYLNLSDLDIQALTKITERRVTEVIKRKFK